MIELKNALELESRILRPGDALPELPDEIGTLFLDVETNSFDESEPAVQPYLGHRIAGIAVTWDDLPHAWYIPMRHTLGPNMDIELVRAWLRKLFARTRRWANHNIKFDAHFLRQDEVIIPPDVELVCTLTRAKLFDSDRFGHGLKDVLRDWCGLKMEEETKLQNFLKNAKTKNYGDAPVDMMAEYACMDVLGNRVLLRYLDERLPDQVKPIGVTEIKLTRTLLDLEMAGMQVNTQELKVELGRSLRKLILLSEKLFVLTEREFSDSNAHLFDVIVNQFNLPVLAWNAETGSPSFDFDALMQYKVHPAVMAEERCSKFIEALVEYREESHFKSLFLESFLRLKDAMDRLHPSYNQVIRTGRMSCKNPNSQQMSKRAKGLIHPGEGFSFLAFDASQIEFRLIVHYINDLDAIEAYLKNPDTDFHQWVAELCHIARKQAKNVNFAIAYGAGKRRILKMLASNPEIIAEVGARVNEAIARGEIPESNRAIEYNRLCLIRAEEIFNTYHERLPGIRRISEVAAKKCEYKGYVFNAFGRRRHLPRKAAFRAFNTVIQGCAMDYIKDRMVVVDADPFLRERNVRLCANVHDELLFVGPTKAMKDPAVRSRILEILETQPIPFRVPFRWSMGFSEKSWADTDSKEGKLDPALYRKVAA